ncbi:LysR family transcriptional regulator [Thalassospira indica]|uniref:LysR family transcriptional regulator n=1 Tax=Thalassospira indica TaxID=1891279 RepID=A0ABN5NQF8_9PROT|nr:LysR family transcriptional regulator [Thalassospira indica]AXO16732.1 LysR family transcriptional regulator [Thalassospira indica]OAZ14386.1 LysR family transcriptional regulator [Thalassospira profundimaris]
MFEFKDIEILQDIVKAGGFRAAAQKYNLSQSAISARVSGLEKKLGILLFDRSNRQVRLTAGGLRFLEEAQRLSRARDRIWQELTHPGELSGTVRIGVAETIVHTLLTDMLNKLKDDFPKVRYELSVDTSGQLAKSLENDEMDVAIMLRESVPQGAVAAPLKPVELKWYCPETMELPDKPMSLRDLASHAIVTFPKGTPPFREVESIFAAPDISQPALHGSASLSTVKHLVAGGFGIGVLPSLMVKNSMWNEQIKEIPVSDEASLTALHFVIAYYPERNREIGAAVQEAAKLFDHNDR